MNQPLNLYHYFGSGWVNTKWYYCIKFCTWNLLQQLNCMDLLNWNILSEIFWQRCQQQIMFNLLSYNHDYALYKNAHYLRVNVFSMNVLIKMGTLFFMSPTGNWTAILCGYPSHCLRCMQREYLHFSVILRPWVLVLPWESNPWPPALQSSALLTELILRS